MATYMEMLVRHTNHKHSKAAWSWPGKCDTSVYMVGVIGVRIPTSAATCVPPRHCRRRCALGEGFVHPSLTPLAILGAFRG